MRKRPLIESLELRTLLHGAGTLSGSVYIDANGDGTRDPEELGVPGIVIQLTGSSESEGSLARSTFTGDDGVYLFDELDPGTYQVAKRQTQSTLDGQDSTSATDAVLDNNRFSNLVLEDGQNLPGNNFGEQGIRPEYVSIAWFFASTPPAKQMLRETIAVSEERAGNAELAASIRAGGSDLPESINAVPIAINDTYSIEQNGVLDVSATAGLLANDLDSDGDVLTANLVDQVTHGVVSISADGGFQYTPETDFAGTDTFTYRANDGQADSSVATVTINVQPPDDGINQAPVAEDDEYSVMQGGTFSTGAAHGVLANDTDVDGDVLTATLVDSTTHGTVNLNADGSFTYAPESGYSGADAFTYQASDAQVSSNIGTVQIDVTPASSGELAFGPVTAGEFDDSNLLGTRTDLVAGAPPITRNHVDGDLDYSNHSNPPTYGDHHGFDPEGTDVNPGITPRPTGIYTVEQPDEDLVHNLEHGHVWISYNPDLINATDLAALEQLTRDGADDPNGAGVGVILTPRAANDTVIALASWAHLLKLDSYDPATIRSFVETNRGHAPEGFITP